jgi:hypothetical protein
MHEAIYLILSEVRLMPVRGVGGLEARAAKLIKGTEMIPRSFSNTKVNVREHSSHNQ